MFASLLIILVGISLLILIAGTKETYDKLSTFVLWSPLSDVKIPEIMKKILTLPIKVFFNFLESLKSLILWIVERDPLTENVSEYKTKIAMSLIGFILMMFIRHEFWNSFFQITGIWGFILCMIWFVGMLSLIVAIGIIFYSVYNTLKHRRLI